MTISDNYLPNRAYTLSSYGKPSIKGHGYKSFVYFLGIIKSLARLKEELNHTRYYTYRFMSLWKILLFLMCILLGIWIEGDDPAMFFQLFNPGFGPHNIVVEEVNKKCF